MSSALLFFALLFAGPSLAEPPSAPAVEPAPQSAQADQSPSESGGEERILTEIAHL